MITPPMAKFIAIADSSSLTYTLDENSFHKASPSLQCTDRFELRRGWVKKFGCHSFLREISIIWISVTPHHLADLVHFFILLPVPHGLSSYYF